MSLMILIRMRCLTLILLTLLVEPRVLGYKHVFGAVLCPDQTQRHFLCVFTPVSLRAQWNTCLGACHRTTLTHTIALITILIIPGCSMLLPVVPASSRQSWNRFCGNWGASRVALGIMLALMHECASLHKPLDVPSLASARPVHFTGIKHDQLTWPIDTEVSTVEVLGR